MAAPSLRLLALGELAENERVFKALLAENESLFVEHKTDIAKGEGYQLAKAAASFANTLGGWILVGVKNGEPVPGWEPPPAGFVDAVRQRLEGQIDPIPSFAADVIEFGTALIGVVRVYESTDTPHILLSDGSIVVREPAQDAKLRKLGRYQATPIRSHYELVQLAQRGQKAEREADERFQPRRLPLVEKSLRYRWVQASEGGIFEGGDDPALILRAAPLNLSSRWREWAVSEVAVERITELVQLMIDGDSEVDAPEPHPSGVAVTARQRHPEKWTPGGHRSVTRVATAVVDSGGVMGLRLGFAMQDGDGYVNDSRALGDPADLEALVDPPLNLLANALTTAEHLGRFAMHLIWLRFGVLFCVDPEDEGRGGPPGFVPGGGLLTIDGLADAMERKALARQWSEELLRAGGISVWRSR